MPRVLPAISRSLATWTHSSRVGTTTSACGTPLLPSATFLMFCSSGTPKPSVLPVPVRAWPMRSCPASAIGSVIVWIAKGAVMPTAASASTVSGRAPIAAKPLGTSAGASVVGDSGAEVPVLVRVVPLVAARRRLRGSQRGSRGVGVDERLVRRRATGGPRTRCGAATATPMG